MLDKEPSPRPAALEFDGDRRLPAPPGLALGVPKTIDNDLDATNQTFGFEGTHAILLPEIPFDLDVVAEAIGRRDAAGRGHAIVVAAEGAQPLGGEPARLAQAGGGHAERLGGIGAWVEAQLAQRTGKECRSVVLGHLLRGGSPSAFDRVVAARFGAAAVRALARGESGVMVALGGQEIGTVPLSEVAGRSKRVPVDGDMVRTARELGICLGDRVDPAARSPLI